MEHLEDSLDTGQTENGLFKFKPINEHRGPYPPSNPADILSKHGEFAGIWLCLQPPLFWEGDTAKLTPKTKGSDRIVTMKISLL